MEKKEGEVEQNQNKPGFLFLSFFGRMREENNNETMLDEVHFPKPRERGKTSSVK